MLADALLEEGLPGYELKAEPVLDQCEASADEAGDASEAASDILAGAGWHKGQAAFSRRLVPPKIAREAVDGSPIGLARDRIVVIAPFDDDELLRHCQRVEQLAPAGKRDDAVAIAVHDQDRPVARFANSAVGNR